MPRKTIIISLTISAVAITVLGVVSFFYGIPDNRLWISPRLEKPQYQCALVRGTLHLVHSTPIDKANPPAQKGEFTFAGFTAKQVIVNAICAEGINIPFWALSMLTAAYPTFVFMGKAKTRRLRRLRTGLNQCVNCGYPLQGLPEPRCPECGRLADNPIPETADAIAPPIGVGGPNDDSHQNPA